MFFFYVLLFRISSSLLDRSVREATLTLYTDLEATIVFTLKNNFVKVFGK